MSMARLPRLFTFVGLLALAHGASVIRSRSVTADGEVNEVREQHATSKQKVAVSADGDVVKEVLENIGDETSEDEVGALLARKEREMEMITGDEAYEKLKEIYILDQFIVAHLDDCAQNIACVTNFFVNMQTAILEGMRIFSQMNMTEEQIAIGIVTMGDLIFDVIDGILPTQVTSQANYTQFKDDWQLVFQALPDTIDEIGEVIREYVNEAKPYNMGKVINICIRAGIDVIKEFLPPDAEAKIGSYLEGIILMSDGVVESWGLYLNGKMKDATELIYNKVVAALNLFLPEEMRNNPNYQAVMGALGTQIAAMDETILRFKRAVEEAKTCWRVKKDRDSIQATTCDSGYWYNSQRRGCQPDGFFLEDYSHQSTLMRHSPNGTAAGLDQQLRIDAASELSAMQSGEKAFEIKFHDKDTRSLLAKRIVKNDMDGTTTRKKKKGPPTRPPRCNPSDPEGFRDTGTDRRCYKECEGGYQISGSQGMCITTCGGNFSSPSTNWGGKAGKGDLCGETSELVVQVRNEIINRLINAIIRTATLIAEMINDGAANAEAISGIVDSFVELAVAFAMPNCQPDNR